jgi:hypothetical protein
VHRQIVASRDLGEAQRALRRQRAEPVAAPAVLVSGEARARRRIILEVVDDAFDEIIGELVLIAAELRRRFSSSGLEMNAVSTSMDGMSGDLSTAKPAFWICV